MAHDDFIVFDLGNSNFFCVCERLFCLLILLCCANSAVTEVTAQGRVGSSGKGNMKSNVIDQILTSPFLDLCCSYY